MATSLSQKLKIKPKDTLLTVNAPSDFKNTIGELPAGVKITSAGQDYYNQVHWFVMNQAQMEKEVSKVVKLLKEDVVIWVYYPKGSSKLQTDLTRDKGWDALMKYDLQWLSLISFNDTWSTFALRLKNEADKKKEAAPKVREIFDWVNPTTKEIRLPNDVAAAMKKNKKEAAFFDTLSFSNKKEYIEWIVTAKREETRNERIKGTIERLGKQWKNPRNM